MAASARHIGQFAGAALIGAALVAAAALPAHAESERNPIYDPTYRPGSLFYTQPLPRQRMQPRQQHEQPERPRAQARPRAGDDAGRAAQQGLVRDKANASTFIVVFGDVLADQLATGLDEALAENAATVVARQTKADSGLVRVDFHDWAKAARDLVAGDQKITIAVIMMGSNDRQPIREGDLTHEPLSERWREIYRDRVDTLLKAFSDRAIPIVWMGNPPMQNTRLSTDVIAINELIRQRVERANGHFVDLWAGFVDGENRFAASGPDINGQVARLRAADGVHFTRAGARKAAHFADVALRRLAPDIAAPSAVAAPASAPAVAPVTAAAPAFSLAVPDVEMPALPLELQPAAIERLIDQMARASVGLEPIAPPVIRVKPAVGPVAPLTGPALARGGEIIPSMAAARGGPQAQDLERVFGEGRLPAPPPGRADDFRWPRR